MATETEAPKTVQAPVAPVEDLFDFANGPAQAAPLPIPASARKAGDVKPAAEAPAAPAAAAPVAAAPRPVALAGISRRVLGLIAGAFVAQLGLLGWLLWRLETKTPQIPQKPFEAPVGQPPEEHAPKATLKSTPSVAREEHGGSAPLDSHPIPPAPKGASALDVADQLLARGAYADARKRYFEVLLSCGPGHEGREIARTARLRIAQCLAREGAPETAPIRLHFASPLDEGAIVPPQVGDRKQQKPAPASGGH
ncbi:MAG: hypothetical protein JNJ88_17290 [Planctomycetes bacterium]|nr:hypothetical protein [Planctomycetota bacterium]